LTKESCRASPKFEDQAADLDARCLGEVMEDLDCSASWMAVKIDAHLDAAIGGPRERLLIGQSVRTYAARSISCSAPPISPTSTCSMLSPGRVMIAFGHRHLCQKPFKGCLCLEHTFIGHSRRDTRPRHAPFALRRLIAGYADLANRKP
jgi:hypothetical protein